MHLPCLSIDSFKMIDPKSRDALSLPDNAVNALKIYPSGKYFIFAIGIDDYEHIPPLENAVNDVQSVVSMLTSKYQFDPADVMILLNEEATRSNIYRQFTNLIRTVSAKDVVLIYYSGHGNFNDDLDEGYWVPVDGEGDDPAGYLSNHEIVRFVEKIGSFHTLVISDSCFSGNLFADDTRGDFGRERLETIPSRWLMTSGRNEKVPDGAPGGHSPFAESLLKHLQYNVQPVWPLTDLFANVMDHVTSNQMQTPRCEPARFAGHEGGEFMFRLKEYAFRNAEAAGIAASTPNPAPMQGYAPGKWRKLLRQPTTLIPVILLLLGMLMVFFLLPGKKDVIADKAVVAPQRDTVYVHTPEKTIVAVPTPKVETPAKKGNAPQKMPTVKTMLKSVEKPYNKPDESKPVVKTEDQPVRVPEPKACMVYCYTFSVPDIKILLHDPAGKWYEAVSNAQSTTLIKVPCSLIGTRVEVTFIRNGKPEDYKNVILSTSEPFEAPQSMKD